MDNQMQAAVIYEAGGPEQLFVENRPIPQVKEGWSLVKVKGFGINHSEIFTRKGLSPSVQFPRILGIECVGEVVETTSNMFSVGQKVVSIMGEMSRDFDGSYAEYVLLPNQQIFPISSSLDWSDLAAVPETFYTAFGAFENLMVTESDRILVRGATSGVGIAFMKLVKAKFPHIHITGTSRKSEKFSLLLEAGFDQVIEDRAGKLQTTAQFDKVLELIGPATIMDTLKHVRERGIVASVGQLGGKWFLEDFDPIMALQNNVYLTTFYSGNVDGKKMQTMFDFIEEFSVEVHPEKIYTLPQIVEAHHYLESSNSYGKVVVINQSL
ncbi:zinc-binding dehydrogenase [Streptococcus ovis]|uniref:zinc-binding dehydrogenase n=1 Tax=Streptococcus ovis TaxID=82806 RepID=UPI00035EB459|nr:zinc-binding dehydrogenase [Streptococcus ovis]